MDLPQLPSDWVNTLNDLAYNRSLSDEGRQQVQRVAEDLRNWHDFESAYALDIPELQQLDNLGYLIEELENADPSRLDLDFLAPRLMQIVRLMDSIRQGREKAAYSPHPAINDLCLAGAAHIAELAQERAIPERVPRVQAWREYLWEDFQSHGDLPPAARQDLENGFRHFDQALEQVAGASEAQSLKNALTQLVMASEVIQVLVEWRKQAHQALTQRYRRWGALPVVGSRLEHLLEEFDAIEAEQVRALIMELAFWWGQNRDVLVLPAAFASEWIPEVDEQLEHLLNLEDPVDRDQLEDCIDELHSGFSEAHSALRSADHLRGGPAGHYFELIQGLLRNTVPVVAVPALFDTSPPPEAWKPVVDNILNYTKGGTRELLYEAREELLRLVPDPAGVEVQDHWVCPFCQARNALGATTCSHCGGGASISLEVPAWDA
jgi:hypothetical protein